MDFMVYLLFSDKLNRYYTGSTACFETRIAFHKISPSNKFTGKARDWKLLLKIPCQNNEQALLVEKHIKSMKSKVYIQNLLKYPEMVEKAWCFH